MPSQAAASSRTNGQEHRIAGQYSARGVRVSRAESELPPSADSHRRPGQSAFALASPFQMHPPQMRSLSLFALLLVAACADSSDRSTAAASELPSRTDSGAPAPASSPSASTAAAASGASTAQPSTSAAASPRAARLRADSAIVRGIYVNRWAAQSPNRMRSLIRLADTTEINAFVIDIKDEFGINYRSADTLVQRNAGRGGVIPGLQPLLDTLEAHGILAIARIVVFKDSVTARANPEWTIRTADGSAWRDKEGLAWVNPYHPALWELNIRVAEEVTRLGFDEIQWDYIRFPEPYRSLPPQVFPNAEGRSKTQALIGFLELAKKRLNALGVGSTADVFGLVTTVNGALEIGQAWEPLSPVTDVMLPMTYPSHYPRGAFGIARPNADPYGVMYAAISKAHERDMKLGITGEHVRPWIQAFTLGAPAYGARELRLQKQAIYDAGYDGWVLWHPGSKYGVFEAGLERETVTRKKDWKPGTPPSPPAEARIPAESPAVAAPRPRADSGAALPPPGARHF